MNRTALMARPFVESDGPADRVIHLILKDRGKEARSVRANLLRQAGFRVERVVTTESEVSVLEAVAA